MASNEQTQSWLKDVLPLHERLSATAAALIESILKKSEIEYLSISARTKTFDGALEKITRKEYARPKTQLTDLSGIRIVTYLEAHAIQIATAIKELFEVDEENSHDRSADLGEDKMGYRSTHFVCSLGKIRGELPEYNGIGALKFEVQIRTVLQHAWAELAHDRSFKFGVALPAKIQRKLNLHSGLLEIVDSAFDEIAREIDEYKNNIEKKSLSQISHTEINSLSLARFSSELSKTLNIKIEDNSDAGLIEELNKYGITSIGDLELLATPNFKNSYKNRKGTTSYGLLRSLMMYDNIDRYFSLGQKFQAMDQATVTFLEKKYRNGEVRKWLDTLDIRTMDFGSLRPASRKTKAPK